MHTSIQRTSHLITLVAALVTALVVLVPGNAGAADTAMTTNALLSAAGTQDGNIPPAQPTGSAGGGGGGSIPDGYFSRSKQWETTQAPPVSGCLGACRARESGTEVRYDNKCRGGNRWGPWEGVEGFEEGRLDYKPGHGKTPGHTWYSAASYDCISAAAWIETPINCVVRFTTSVVGPIGNPYVAKTTTMLHQQEDTPFAQTGKTKPVLCERSRALPVGAALDHYGKWQIKATRRIATCTLYTYVLKDTRTQQLPPPRIDNCATLPSDAISAKAQVICERPGWNNGWSTDHAYTPQDCLTHPGGVWDCGMQPHPPRLDGRPATPANVSNDGADHSLQYSPPAPRGEVRNIHEDRVRLTFLGGTPHRAGVDNAADTQPFIVNPTIDDWVYGWNGMGDTAGTDFTVNFQAPSVAGRPWTAAPQWAFTAGFGKTIPDVQVIDAYTADFRAQNVYDWERLPATCTGTAAEVGIYAPRQR